MNYNLWAPFLIPIDTSAGDHTFDTCLRGVDVFAPGDVHVTDDIGNDVTLTFPTVANGGCYPCRYIAQIRTIHDDSTVADSDLIGLR